MITSGSKRRKTFFISFSRAGVINIHPFSKISIKLILIKLKHFIKTKRQEQDHSFSRQKHEVDA